VEFRTFDLLPPDGSFQRVAPVSTTEQPRVVGATVRGEVTWYQVQFGGAAAGGADTERGLWAAALLARTTSREAAALPAPARETRAAVSFSPHPVLVYIRMRRTPAGQQNDPCRMTARPSPVYYAFEVIGAALSKKISVFQPISVNVVPITPNAW
jgi:hypothetical protein